MAVTVLWTCDRCGGEERRGPGGDRNIPSGWRVVELRWTDAAEAQLARLDLCEACRAYLGDPSAAFRQLLAEDWQAHQRDVAAYVREREANE